MTSCWTTVVFRRVSASWISLPTDGLEVQIIHYIDGYNKDYPWGFGKHRCHCSPPDSSSRSTVATMRSSTTKTGMDIGSDYGQWCVATHTLWPRALPYHWQGKFARL